MTPRDHVVAIPRVCILVLNYNGLIHLQDCLSSLERAVARFGRSCPVVLVDNQSTDESVTFTRNRFPAVEVQVAPRNDFLFSLNDVVRGRREDVVIIVNNDMRFDDGFIAPLVAHFERPAVFGVGAAIRDWDDTADTVGPRCARVSQFWFYKWWSYDRQEAALTLEACGGAAAYRRGMFVELGGFDPLFRPGYYEDLDLSYRAWGRGWSVVYEPRSRAFHRESASMIARFGDAKKQRVLYRNHLLFTIKNIGGPAFLIGFFFCLPYRVLSPLLAGHRVPLDGALAALPRMPAALKARWTAAARRPDLSRFVDVTPLASAAMPTATVPTRARA